MAGAHARRRRQGNGAQRQLAPTLRHTARVADSSGCRSLNRPASARLLSAPDPRCRAALASVDRVAPSTARIEIRTRPRHAGASCAAAVRERPVRDARLTTHPVNDAHKRTRTRCISSNYCFRSRPLLCASSLLILAFRSSNDQLPGTPSCCAQAEGPQPHD